MDKYKFGEYIYNKRKNLGLTQDELGKQLGVTNKAVSKWEVGETCPDITMLVPLAHALGVSVDELLSYTDKEDETKEKQKIVRINVLLIVIIGVLLLLEVVTLGFLLTKSNDINNEFTEVYITNDNIKEIVAINPSSQIVCDGVTLVVDSTYQLNDGFSFVDNNEVTFTIVYQYQYYYYLNDGSIGIVTYYNRFHEIVLSNDTKEMTISILLEPKFNVDDFKGFNQVKISYIVLDAKGKVMKNENGN